MNISYTTSGTNATYSINPSSCSTTSSEYVIKYYNHTGVLIAIPGHWFPKDGESPLPDAFARLVNEETNTGWKIRGYMQTVREYPPGIPHVSLSEFKKMLLNWSNATDAAKINQWFRDNVQEDAV